MKKHMLESPSFKHTFQGMETGVIIGIIDHQDAIESYFIPLNEMDQWMHGDVFDFRGVFHRWRWHYKDGISTTTDDFKYAEKIDVESTYRIESHLTRIYGIQFDDRGCVDWEHFQNKIKDEEKNGIKDPYDD
jgi:hypothetical protein